MEDTTNDSSVKFLIKTVYKYEQKSFQLKRLAVQPLLSAIKQAQWQNELPKAFQLCYRKTDQNSKFQSDPDQIFDCISVQEDPNNYVLSQKDLELAIQEHQKLTNETNKAQLYILERPINQLNLDKIAPNLLLDERELHTLLPEPSLLDETILSIPLSDRRSELSNINNQEIKEVDPNLEPDEFLRTIQVLKLKTQKKLDDFFKNAQQKTKKDVEQLKRYQLQLSEIQNITSPRNPKPVTIDLSLINEPGLEDFDSNINTTIANEFGYVTSKIKAQAEDRLAHICEMYQQIESNVLFHSEQINERRKLFESGATKNENLPVTSTIVEKRTVQSGIVYDSKHGHQFYEEFDNDMNFEFPTKPWLHELNKRNPSMLIKLKLQSLRVKINYDICGKVQIGGVEFYDFKTNLEEEKERQQAEQDFKEQNQSDLVLFNPQDEILSGIDMVYDKLSLRGLVLRNRQNEIVQKIGDTELCTEVKMLNVCLHYHERVIGFRGKLEKNRFANFQLTVCRVQADAREMFHHFDNLLARQKRVSQLENQNMMKKESEQQRNVKRLELELELQKKLVMAKETELQTAIKKLDQLHNSTAIEFSFKISSDRLKNNPLKCLFVFILFIAVLVQKYQGWLKKEFEEIKGVEIPDPETS